MKRALALLACLLGAPAAEAHPHVWIEATLGFVFEGQKIAALEITWTFDDLYSELVREDFDLDGDGTLSQQELDALVGVSAANLMEYSFFTHLKIDEETPRIRAVREFYAELQDDGLILYRFRVPLAEPLDPRRTRLAVGLYDESYYVDILLPPGDIALDPTSGCHTEARQDLVPPLYFGTFHPTYRVVTCG